MEFKDYFSEKAEQEFKETIFAKRVIDKVQESNLSEDCKEFCTYVMVSSGLDSLAEFKDELITRIKDATIKDILEICAVISKKYLETKLSHDQVYSLNLNDPRTIFVISSEQNVKDEEPAIVNVFKYINLSEIRRVTVTKNELCRSKVITLTMHIEGKWRSDFLNSLNKFNSRIPLDVVITDETQDIHIDTHDGFFIDYNAKKCSNDNGILVELNFGVPV